MTIPESQLETWSKQGSVAQSSATYQITRKALLASEAAYANKNFEVFLQGSYGNDTNIYADSDVDIVMRLDSIYGYDISDLLPEQQEAFRQGFSAATYTFAEFKQEVITRLSNAFGPDNVTPRNKAIRIKAGGSRRSADVVVCYQYRHYLRFKSSSDYKYIPGIILASISNGYIINYPKLHSQNVTAKHQATNNNFKPLVRIFKNMRGKLEADGLIEEGGAPSYFIEGLLYNVPNRNFSGSYKEMVLNILNWLYQTTDRTKFTCANEQHYLLRNNNAICWPVANGEKFINAAIRLWNNW
ncbi:nucleotidyltransferase [Ktedonobacter sp. SOSP1-85]|uniref:nucleotidyltransferase domain-containing protein n=1 Tax=Ktedonobacter sp. SOSP1-85 TaxID=2778367 RepID=UPI001915AC7D|nr:nucleotidyltransferase [Ktedonobacter sp. SOSP1-85]GHO73942.1 nucleotidyltransferase [Ktedonobacter sp. SOSP1-85]